MGVGREDRQQGGCEQTSEGGPRTTTGEYGPVERLRSRFHEDHL